MALHRIARAALAVAVGAHSAAAQSDTFTPPHRFEWLTGVPGTLGAAAHATVRARNLPKVGAVLGATLVLYAADPWLYDHVRDAGHSLGLSAQHPEWALHIGGAKIFYVPTTISSALYYLGDGWTTMGVAGGFYITSKVRHSNRAARTASEITQSMFALGIVTQTLKHATGRQTPSASTNARGEWHPFVSWKEYGDRTPNYDAMPSGHLATAMATVTVIAANYPDSRIVKPIGYTLMTALSFTMINNGVHWASDYPLALGIGGTIGTMAARRGHPVSGSSPAARVEPFYSGNAIGWRVNW